MSPLSTDYPQFLGDLLESTAQRFPDKEALVYGDQRWTWSALNQQVKALSCAFLECGVLHGDRIGVLSTTRPEYLLVYLAAARIGAMMVGFNVLYTPLEITRLAHLTTPKVMVVLDKIRDKALAAPLKSVFEALDCVQAYIVMGDVIPEGSLSFARLLQHEFPQGDGMLAQRKTELDPDDGALMVFTSGSTGQPKAAVLTHRSILSVTEGQVRHFGYQAKDRVLQNKPMNHVGGTINQTLPTLAVGGTLVLMDHFHPERALDIIQREQITILGQVPTMFIMELTLPTFQDYDLSSLRLAIVGGAATPVPVMNRIRAMAGQVMTGYGMTETGGYITYTGIDDDPQTIATTVGRAAPEFEVRIVDDKRHPLPSGQVGEIAIRGACLLKAYFANPSATAEAMDADGWFYSGDMGYLDSRDYLTLVGRKKEMFISGGYNVYPREVEQYISQYEKVALVAVLGRGDAVMGEVGVAFIVPIPDAVLSADEILRYCAAGLAEYKIPREVFIREALPLTPLGKINKPRLQEELSS